MMSKVLSQKRWSVSVRKPKKMQGEKGHVKVSSQPTPCHSKYLFKGHSADASHVSSMLNDFFQLARTNSHSKTTFSLRRSRRTRCFAYGWTETQLSHVRQNELHDHHTSRLHDRHRQRILSSVHDSKATSDENTRRHTLNMRTVRNIQMHGIAYVPHILQMGAAKGKTILS